MEALVVGCKWYALASLIHLCLLFAIEKPPVHAAFTRVAWRLGPWPSFPFPYDPADWIVRLERPHVSERMLEIVVSAAMLFTLMMVVGAVHGLTFAFTVAIHRWIGWPRYWRDVRQSIDLSSVWAVSAKRSWWVWPVGQLVWLILEQAGYGFSYAFYPIIGTGSLYLVTNTLGICLVFATVTSRSLRTTILESVRPDDLRCGRCGYLLRGLPIMRCPECGYQGNQSGKVEYSLLRQESARGGRVRKLMVPVVIVALLSSSVWVPLGLAILPWSLLRFVPESIRPDRQVLDFDPNVFPIRFGTICLVRHAGSIAVVRSIRKPYGADYDVSFWSREEAFGPDSPPDSIASGKMTWRCQPGLLLGPWEFGCSFGDNMFWLYRPDNTYSVEAFDVSGLPERLRWLEQGGGGPPESPHCTPAGR